MPDRPVLTSGQEWVWDYPRPPRVEPSVRQVRVVLNGRTIADTRRAVRVLETSHPPVWYVPRADVVRDALAPNLRSSVCEFKGVASYFDVVAGGRRELAAAWSYERPAPGYEALAGHIAFYPGRMEACFVDDEPVTAQPGDFYGGWITRDIVGPFKGGPGSVGW
ncbi:MAG: DUF427 domain-containing protein [Candidatus Sericytochromatia bacterium]